MESAALQSVFVDMLRITGFVGLVAAALAGLWLVASPGAALRFAARLNREYSIAWLQRALDAPRSSEPFIYRHHLIVGPLLIAATAYFFWQFFTNFDSSAIAELYAGALPPVVLEILALAFTSVLVLGNGIGMVLGFVVLVRPSLLKGTESTMNRWIASERAFEVLDRRDDRPETLAHRHPRRVGIAILLATGYIFLIWAAVIA